VGGEVAQVRRGQARHDIRQKRQEVVAAMRARVKGTEVSRRGRDGG